MKKKKEALAVVVTAALLAALLHGAGWLLLPYADYNGTDWRRYAREPENSVDVLYVGSSLVFCDLDPVGIYGRCGVTGFNVAGPQQSMAISYYNNPGGLPHPEPARGLRGAGRDAQLAGG